MLDRLIDLAVHRRTATLLFTLALFAGGLYTYFNLPIEAYPDVTNLQVNIITLFPGQASEEVERQVTIPLERGLSALPKAIDLRSVSVFGLSYIIVTFDDEVDMYFARQVVTERLRQVDLPDGVVSVLGPQITPLGEVYQFTVDGGGKSPTELRTLLDWTIVPFLKQVPGVADIVAQGGFRKEIHILVGPDRLNAHGTTLTTVYEALSRANANIGAGDIRHRQEQYIVRGLWLLRSRADLKVVGLTTAKRPPGRRGRLALPAFVARVRGGRHHHPRLPADGLRGTLSHQGPGQPDLDGRDRFRNHRGRRRDPDRKHLPPAGGAPARPAPGPDRDRPGRQRSGGAHALLPDHHHGGAHSDLCIPAGGGPDLQTDGLHLWIRADRRAPVLVHGSPC